MVVHFQFSSPIFQFQFFIWILTSELHNLEYNGVLCFNFFPGSSFWGKR